MPLDVLPLSLQQCVLLEWLSPETVWTLVRASGTLRHCVLSSPQTFRAADKEVLSDACVRWFRERGVQLVLYTEAGRVGGYQWWTTNGKFHRDDDLPAIDMAYGMRMWYQNGKLHRDGDQPAYISADGGTQKWYQNDKLHRDGDRPAVILAYGLQFWYRNGVRQAEI